MDEGYHLAAVYDLAVPEDVARRVNVVGTAKVLEFLESFPGEVRLNYISTCYVSGYRQGMVFEDDLDRGQRFAGVVGGEDGAAAKSPRLLASASAKLRP